MAKNIDKIPANLVCYSDPFTVSLCKLIMINSLVLVACRMIVFYSLPRWVGLMCTIIILFRVLFATTEVNLHRDPSPGWTLLLQLCFSLVSLVCGVGMFMIVSLKHQINLTKNAPQNFGKIKSLLDSNPSILTLALFYYPIDVMFISGIISFKYAIALGWMLLSKIKNSYVANQARKLTT